MIVGIAASVEHARPNPIKPRFPSALSISMSGRDDGAVINGERNPIERLSVAINYIEVLSGEN